MQLILFMQNSSGIYFFFVFYLLIFNIFFGITCILMSFHMILQNCNVAIIFCSFAICYCQSIIKCFHIVFLLIYVLKHFE